VGHVGAGEDTDQPPVLGGDHGPRPPVAERGQRVHHLLVGGDRRHLSGRHHQVADAAALAFLGWHSGHDPQRHHPDQPAVLDHRIGGEAPGAGGQLDELGDA
jgi:hypothetical protein